VISPQPSQGAQSAVAQSRNVGSPPRSLLSYSPPLFLLVILIADAAQTGDPDLWWHLRFGQSVLATHHLVWRDPYSYSALGHPWGNLEWLGEIVMAVAYNLLGVVGLKIWKFVCVAATLLFMTVGMAETGASPSIQLDLLIAAALAMMPQMQFRPQLFTYVLLSALLALLARHAYRGTVALWIVIPMLALWSNLHGGFIAGLAVLLVYAGVDGLRRVAAGEGFRRAAGPGLIASGAVLATLVSPYGSGNWSTAISTVGNRWTRVAVIEWHPLWTVMARQWRDSPLGEFNYVLMIGLMAALVVTFALTRRGADLPLVAVGATMSVAALVSARNIPLAVIACVNPIARLTSIAVERSAAQLQRDTQPALVEARSGVKSWIVIAVAAFLAIYIGAFSSRLPIGRGFPSGAVAFMKEHGLRGNVLNDYDWGGYLLWQIGPESKDFIDGRFDTVFPQEVLDDYFVFYFDRPGASKILDKYPHDFVLIPPKAPAFRLLEIDPHWKLIYQDRSAALFARSRSPAAKFATVQLRGVDNERSYFPG
jgi:hypothetical protein